MFHLCDANLPKWAGAARDSKPASSVDNCSCNFVAQTIPNLRKYKRSEILIALRLGGLS